MKKFLLIPILLIAGAISASAHCGTCGTGEAHDKAAAKACPADCVKACCTKDAAKCDKDAAKCDKDAAKCDKAAAKCEKKKAAAAAAPKACCPSGK